MRINGGSANVTIKESAKHAIVELDTGEITPVYEVRGKFVFPGGFIFMGLDYNTKLYSTKLPADAYRLVHLLIQEGGWTNIYLKPFKHLADTLEVSQPRISRLLGILESHQFVQRIGGGKGGAIMINPTFSFKGNSKEQKKAIELWCSHRPYNVEQRKTA